MNIVELSEKSFQEAKNLFVTVKSNLYTCLGENIEEVAFEDILSLNNDDNTTYMLTDKGAYGCLVTINKQKAEISNLWINFDLVEEQYLVKFMEFTIKQFSAISLVFIWVDSIDVKTTQLLEDYGFEYTGEQSYLDKEKNISKFHYMYRRRR